MYRASTSCLSILLLILLWVPPSPVAAGEKVDIQGLGPKAAGAVKAYLQKSSPALDKLVGIIMKGTSGSANAWHGVCRGAITALGKLQDNREVVVKRNAWITAEAQAWGRMSLTGLQIAAVNEQILENLDIIELANRVSRDELRTTTRAVKEAVTGAVEGMLRESADVSRIADNLDKAMELVGDEELFKPREVMELFGKLKDELEDVADQVGQVERAEYWLRRFGDSIRRRKINFSKTNDRVIHQQRRDLARLVSIKIDPDGRGAFSRVEGRIETEAEKNLVKFQRAVEEWRSINKPLAQNARDFVQEFVIPAVGKALRALPDTIFGVPVPGSVWKLHLTLGKAADGYAGWLDKQYDRYTGAYYERILGSLGSWREELEGVKVEEDVALLRVDRQRTDDVDDLRQDAKDEIRELASDRNTLRAKLQALPDEADTQRARAKLEAAILDLASEIELEDRVLQIKIKRLDRVVERRKSKVQGRYERRKSELRRAIRAMESVGGR